MSIARARIAIVGAIVAIVGTAWAGTLATSPDRLTLDATRGDVVVREVGVKDSTPPWTIEAMPLSTAEGAQQDLDAITLESATNKTGAHVVRITITLDDTDVGAYRTEIFVRDSAGSVARVPVDISVKAWWVLPLILLVVGAAIGWGISYYRTYRQDRDEITERIGVTHERLASVRIDLFRAEIEKKLTIARESRDTRKWTAATTALDESDAILLRYREHADDWKRAIDYAAELEQRVAGAVATGTETYRGSLREAIAAIRRSAVEAASPSVVTAALAPFVQRVRRYLELDAILVDDLPGVKAWRTKLDALEIVDDDAAKKLVEQIMASVPEGVQFDAPNVDVVSLPQMTEGEIAAGRRARKRRSIMLHASLFAGFVVVAAGGFKELYLDDATFGSIWDYVTIALWGLGSEAVRESVTKAAEPK